MCYWCSSRACLLIELALRRDNQLGNSVNLDGSVARGVTEGGRSPTGGTVPGDGANPHRGSRRLVIAMCRVHFFFRLKGRMNARQTHHGSTIEALYAKSPEAQCPCRGRKIRFQPIHWLSDRSRPPSAKREEGQTRTTSVRSIGRDIHRRGCSHAAKRSRLAACWYSS